MFAVNQNIKSIIDDSINNRINVYRATDGTEKLGMGEGNTKSITVSFSPERAAKVVMAIDLNKVKASDLSRWPVAFGL